MIFVGRVEPDKGVLDLVEIADQLRTSGDLVHFHVCGMGSALEALKARLVERHLETAFTLHGWCDLEKLRSVYARSQLATVPTRSDFVEGFNQVFVEAVLAGRRRSSRMSVPVVAMCCRRPRSCERTTRRAMSPRAEHSSVTATISLDAFVSANR